MLRALVLVDLENEWRTPGSDYFVGDLVGIIKRTNKLIEVCRERGFKIIFIRHVEEGSKKVFAENNERTAIIEEINKKDEDTVITKNKISPFYKTNLDKELEGIGEIVVGGILTNLCVRSLIHDAYDREFGIKVIKNCCVARDKETQDFTFKDLKKTREEVEFINLEEFIGE